MTNGNRPRDDANFSTLWIILIIIILLGIAAWAYFGDGDTIIEDNDVITPTSSDENGTTIVTPITPTTTGTTSTGTTSTTSP